MPGKIFRKNSGAIETAFTVLAGSGEYFATGMGMGNALKKSASVI
jgi:hypothetical protein